MFYEYGEREVVEVSRDDLVEIGDRGTSFKTPRRLYGVRRRFDDQHLTPGARGIE